MDDKLVKVELKKFKVELEAWIKQVYDTALPNFVDKELFMRCTYTYLNNKPELLMKDHKSLFRALTTCAVLGLYPEKEIGLAYLVPFKDEIVVIPGYKGYIHLARNSGEIKDIYAVPVFEKDEFYYQLGTNPMIKHIPTMGDPGKVICAYTVINYMNGGRQFTVARKFDIEKAKSRSPAFRNYSKYGGTTPWVEDEDTMAMKTSVRMSTKFMPLAAQRAASLEGQYEQGNVAHLGIDGTMEINAEITPMEDNEFIAPEKSGNPFMGDNEENNFEFNSTTASLYDKVNVVLSESNAKPFKDAASLSLAAGQWLMDSNMPIADVLHLLKKDENGWINIFVKYVIKTKEKSA